MQTADYDTDSNAVVWVNEKPHATYPVIRTVIRELAQDLSSSPSGKSKTCCVEILKPMGAKFRYGLLGLEFIPDDSRKFLVEVLISNEDGNIYKKSIASKLDTVRFGLIDEYSSAVIEQIVKSLDAHKVNKLGSGILRVNQAAHGEISSSCNFFQYIAETLILLLMSQV